MVWGGGGVGERINWLLHKFLSPPELHLSKLFRGHCDVSRTLPLAGNGHEEAEGGLAVSGVRWEEGGWPPESCLPCQSHACAGSLFMYFVNLLMRNSNKLLCCKDDF